MRDLKSLLIESIFDVDKNVDRLDGVQYGERLIYDFKKLIDDGDYGFKSFSKVQKSFEQDIIDKGGEELTGYDDMDMNNVYVMSNTRGKTSDFPNEIVFFRYNNFKGYWETASIKLKRWAQWAPSKKVYYKLMLVTTHWNKFPFDLKKHIKPSKNNILYKLPDTMALMADRITCENLYGSMVDNKFKELDSIDNY